MLHPWMYFGVLPVSPSLYTTRLGENHVQRGDWQIGNDITALEEYERETVETHFHTLHQSQLTANTPLYIPALYSFYTLFILSPMLVFELNTVIQGYSSFSTLNFQLYLNFVYGSFMLAY